VVKTRDDQEIYPAMAKPTSKRFITVDYEEALDLTVSLRECLPSDHLACFLVAIIALLDLSCIYVHYGDRGGKAYAPEILLGLLFYGYATGVFSSREIEKKTDESIPFHYIAGGMHIDHDTIADFRKTFLPAIRELFVQILLLAHVAGVLKLGNISLDGTKIHADASKSRAVSYKRLGELKERLRQEIEELLALGKQADQVVLPEGMDIEDEIIFRKNRLTNLAEAKSVLEARAQERYETELAEYEAKMRAREEKARQTGRQPRGRAPQPPVPGPRAKDQYNFTDPESRVMKNSTDGGFNQHYNVQVAVDQDSLLIVSNALSNHPNDYDEALPTLDAIPAELGKPEAAALDNGYFSESNITEMEARGITPYIATGREAHHRDWKTYFAEQSAPPPERASPTVKMAHKLRTEIGRAIYRLRKCTVEPVIGIIKEVLGFRQFSLRGLAAAAGEWCLVCLTFNLKRLHRLLVAC
jgi:transposase